MPAKEPELPTAEAVDPMSAASRGEFVSKDPLEESKFPETPPSNAWLEPWENDRVYGICSNAPPPSTSS